MIRLSRMKSIVFSIPLLLILSACAQPGGDSASSTGGNNSGIAMPFAVTVLPNPGALHATLVCPNGSVPMQIDPTYNTLHGSCSGLSAGPNQTFTIKLTYTYVTQSITIASATRTIAVGNGNTNLGFLASDYVSDIYDTDNDGISNFDEIVNGTDPTLSYGISGQIDGLKSGAKLTLQNNGGNATTITGTGGTQSFTMKFRVDGSSSYNVTSLLPASANQICGVGNGIGTGPITADIADVKVTCVDNTGKKIAGFYRTFVIRPDGTLWAWGNDDFGALGDGATVQQNAPEQIGTDNHWASISAGFYHTVAIKTDGTLWSWGDNIFCQLGYGTIDSDNHPTPMQVGNETNWIKVAAGSHFNVALRKDTGGTVTLWSWGDNNYGQIGDGQDPTVELNVSSPKKIIGATNWVDIIAGAGHAAGLQSDGTYTTLWTWGNNADGELGDGKDPSVEPFANTPQPIGSATDHWVSIAAKGINTAALRQDTTGHTLLVWGNNDFGQIGDGSDPGTVFYVNTPTPVPLPANTSDWVQVESCGITTVALARGSNGADVTLWAWGDNSASQLGDPQFTDAYITVPRQVGILTNWANIMASRGWYIFAQQADANGTLWAWGGNGFGEIGNGNDPNDPNHPENANVTAPIQIGTATSFKYHTVGGTVTGLATGESLTIDNEYNNQPPYPEMTITANGPFVFPTGYTANDQYAVFVLTPVAGKTCTPKKNVGPATATNVWDISIDCTTP